MVTAENRQPYSRQTEETESKTCRQLKKDNRRQPAKELQLKADNQRLVDTADDRHPKGDTQGLTETKIR